jgi:hypothetical protein
MKFATSEAKRVFDKMNVPVSAVVVCNDMIIAKAGGKIDVMIDMPTLIIHAYFSRKQNHFLPGVVNIIWLKLIFLSFFPIQHFVQPRHSYF